MLIIQGVNDCRAAVYINSIPRNVYTNSLPPLQSASQRPILLFPHRRIKGGFHQATHLHRKESLSQGQGTLHHRNGTQQGIPAHISRNTSRKLSIMWCRTTSSATSRWRISIQRLANCSNSSEEYTENRMKLDCAPFA